MARLSLFVATMACSVGVVGCFDAPPTYSVPERLPPVIDAARSQPSTSDVFSTNAGTVAFDVFFRADDDEDDPLRAYVVHDLPAGPPTSSNTVLDRSSLPLDPRPFEDQFKDPRRTLSFLWAVGETVTGRCHTVTLILSYVSNFNDVAYTLADPSLAAQVTWFLDLTGKASADDTACWASGKPKVTQQ
jgi:hypothetical protein